MYLWTPRCSDVYMYVHVHVSVPAPVYARCVCVHAYFPAGCKKEEFPVSVPCVDTHRRKPKVLDY